MSLSLTPRETDVMSWVAQGKTNNDIAIILDISAHTVDTHLRRAFKKLGTYNRTVAAVLAVQNDLVPVPFMAPAN